MKNAAKKILLAVLVVLLAIAPLIVLRNAGFEGADTIAVETITEISPGYERWVVPLWEPPGGEIESLLFALQAAIGAGVIGYGIGFLRGRRSEASSGGA